MARYSRVRGPAANFELTTTLTTVPGLSITRSFGRGTLDISIGCMFVNLVAGPVAFASRLRIDGVAIQAADPLTDLLASTGVHFSQRLLQAVDPGLHTIDFQVSGSASAGDRINADTGELVVIELPEWDDDVNLVIL